MLLVNSESMIFSKAVSNAKANIAVGTVCANTCTPETFAGVATDSTYLFVFH